MLRCHSVRSGEHPLLSCNARSYAFGRQGPEVRILSPRPNLLRAQVASSASEPDTGRRSSITFRSGSLVVAQHRRCRCSGQRRMRAGIWSLMIFRAPASCRSFHCRARQPSWIHQQSCPSQLDTEPETVRFRPLRSQHVREILAVATLCPVWRDHLNLCPPKSSLSRNQHMRE